jgi:glutamyl-tRNA synthetase
VPEGQTRFTDLVRGEIVFDHANIEDFVVLRSDGHPTYHLSVVVDDVDMEITHVVRGDDHISNTPKQVLLYGASGRPTPAFAHVPLILGPDKKRLSKRHGATSVTEYARMGYLPEAMVNFLALLGWSPGGDREVMTRGELVAAFSLEGISGGNAVFNTEKLDWFNHQHLLRLSDDELLDRLEPELKAAGFWRDAFRGEERAWFFKVIDQLRPRAKKLDEFVEQGRPFFGDVDAYDPDAVAKRLKEPGLAAHVAALRASYAVCPFDEATLEATLRQVAEASGVKAGALIHATRIALTGRMVSPGLFEMIALIGRDTVLARLERLTRFLEGRSA